MRKSTQFFVMLLLLAGIFVFARSFSTAGEKDTAMTIEPLLAEYVQGEALGFALTLTNRASEPVRVSLGSEGIGNLRVTLTRDNKAETFAPPTRPGWSIDDAVDVPARGVASHRFYLDEIVRVSAPGTYELSVYIDGSDILPATTTFRLLPDTDANRGALKSRYSEMQRSLNSSDASAESQADTRKAIVLSRHPLALDMQMGLLESRSWSDHYEYEKLIDALVSSESPRAIRSLVESVLANPESPIAEKSVVLNSLRIAEANTWQGDASELLAPYMNDITSSTPMVISD